jgi:Flp pilus assembly protein TadD
MLDWYGRASSGHQTFAEAFDAADRYAAGASAGLLSLVHDRDQPAIVRASALSRLARDPSSSAVEAAVEALNDDDELVRRAGVELLATAQLQMRVRYLPRMVEDPVRAVRIAAARALAAVPDGEIPEDRRAALARAMDEYVAAQTYNADRPEAHLNLGALHQARGEFEQAEAAYRKALALYPNAPQALINLADLYRARGDEAEAEALLIAGVRTHPASASLHHALGLSYARQKKGRQALEQLSAAARLGQDDPAYAYVYGVALHSYGDPARAVAVLERAHQRFTGERSILQALASMERDRGNTAKALVYARKMVEAAPEDGEAQALLRALAR